jgi:hypothetical protein
MMKNLFWFVCVLVTLALLIYWIITGRPEPADYLSHCEEMCGVGQVASYVPPQTGGTYGTQCFCISTPPTR